MAVNRVKVDAYEIIKEKIQFLEYRPGMKIVENDLAKELGVSRTPIREALKRLEEEGFIDIYPQRGTYVSYIDMKLVKEVTFTRHILEMEICKELCDKRIEITPLVEDKLLMMQLALKHKDYKEYIELDSAFHRSLFKAAKHEQIWDIISMYLAHYSRVLVLDMMMEDNLENSYKSHLRIAKAIDETDINTLEEILETHHDHVITENDKKIMARNPQYFVQN